MEFFAQINDDDPSFFLTLKEAFFHIHNNMSYAYTIRLGVSDHGVFYLRGPDYPLNVMRFWLARQCISTSIAPSAISQWMMNNNASYCQKIEDHCVLENIHVRYDSINLRFITDFQFNYLPSNNPHFYIYRFMPFCTLSQLMAGTEDNIDWRQEGF